MTPGEKTLFEARMRRELKGLEDRAMRAEWISPSRRRKSGIKYTPLLGILFAESVAVEGYSHLQLIPVHRPINDILAEYFDIDLSALESEKRAMLEKLRGTNNA